MADLDEQLDQWLGQVKRVAQMPLTEQTKITKPGANAFAKMLKEQTKAAHPNTKKAGKYGHLSGDIKAKGANADGIKDGTSSVNFGKKDFVARFLNDGTKNIKGDQFVDNARTLSSGAVFKAEQEAYEAYIKKVGGKA